ncbi:cysteinyl-tRNA synthetase [Gregarina niphandrodes]|uniref:cysteine--tRNA ligase n=1 Tax=Gregarina niphandrodes TaxID=110365 RepID=A0A023B4N4_GRENI|nr:cysteinyl-tRNA synthetase [Gregarina niphandrodes]EZG57002.1 cysteinyl-tRNA synthetase [Gregarina niphandrodes]|eukprot:XP_011131114.1 cysteinyl-tRNA synthetase [Gregarina niphandrodes]
MPHQTESTVSAEPAQATCHSSVADNWVAPNPTNAFVTGLKVSNSMAGGKVTFIPENGNTVNWYGCGPTVYDSAHMGHARNYITFDILRRIMEDYFGYNVNMCMNVTDIDDKIIARARELHIPPNQLARYYENDFWRNLQALNCKMPDIITRVSEFIPEIQKFILKIIDNGYAYESGGSVYFDTTAFRNSEKHVYGRMEPWSVNDEARVLEGEGSLGVVGEKKCPLDFALWKKAKEGEPFWESVWGRGRPGWHIECSAMASDALGFPIDVHSGGIDLRFPHHDNELAQTEANFNRPQWVNYFLHSGHLHIQGLKMSKSLKNFITISAILENYDPKIVRLLVLLHRWDQPMNYHPKGESMKEPAEIHRTLSNFFATMKTLIRKAAKLEIEWSTPGDAKMDMKCCTAANQHWNQQDRSLLVQLNACQSKVHSALCDNFDTPSAVGALQQLITDVNKYISEQSADEYKGTLLIKVTSHVHRLMRVFGLVESENIFGYVSEAAAGGVDQRFADVMDLLGEFRHQVRDQSRGLMKKSATMDDARDVARSLLGACDEIRDKRLTALGVRLEDQGEKGFMWKELNM